jgi:hypothetical protein
VGVVFALRNRERRRCGSGPLENAADGEAVPTPRGVNDGVAIRRPLSDDYVARHSATSTLE